MKKKAEFSFVWLFAIVVGVAILFFAIYGATKATGVQQTTTDSAVAKHLSSITDPLQTGFADGTFGKITFRQETKVYNDCQATIGGFGRNEIAISTRSNVGEEWPLPGVPSMLYNKYIFSDDLSTGKEYYVFSKPFKLPYKVSDVIIMTPEKYCFINAPEEIKDEVESLNMVNIATENCNNDEEYTKVCFESSTECDIIVYGSCIGSHCESEYSEGTVQKGGEFMKYDESLLFAAIVADPFNYHCNVERLYYRTAKIAQIFAEKADLMDARNCGTNLKADLIAWNMRLDGANSDELLDLKETSRIIERKNEMEVCGLWD